MCITKLGQDTLPRYLWKGVKSVGGFLGRLPQSKLRKPGAAITTGVTAVGKRLINAVGGTGKFLYRNPQIAVPAAALGYIAGKNISDNIYKNMYHVDPKYNITRSNALGQIVYTNPGLREKYKELSIFNV